jgi:hypothetical protein
MKFAFAKCSSLRSVSIPKSLSTVDKDAFYHCPRLRDVYYEGSAEDFMNVFYNKNVFPRGATIHYNCEI